jgi:hypothetical protein
MLRTTLLASMVLAGCTAAVDAPGDDEALASTESPIVQVKPGVSLTLPPKYPFVPGAFRDIDLGGLGVTLAPPAWSTTTCSNAGAPRNRFIVRTTGTSCPTTIGSGDAYWSGGNAFERKFTGACAYDWINFTAVRTPDWAALDRIAARTDAGAPAVFRDCAARRSRCTTAECDDVTAPATPGRPSLHGMMVDPCTSCGFLIGNSLYVSLLEPPREFPGVIGGDQRYAEIGSSFVFFPHNGQQDFVVQLTTEQALGHEGFVDVTTILRTP